MKRFLTILLPVLALLSLSSCTQNRNDPWGDTGKKPRVLVSFPGLYSFAAAVAGDDAIVKSFTTGQGVHFHADFSNRDLELCRNCNLFIANGLGIDDRTVKKLQSQVGGNWDLVTASQTIDKANLYEGACNHNHGEEEEGHHHHEHAIDGHVWLGIPQAKSMVQAIRNSLKKQDPDHAEGYERRAAAYLAKLDALEAEGKALLKDKKERTILSFHDSLQYFAKSFNLKIGAVIELSPGVEPTPAELKDLIRRINILEARVIAVEPQFSRNTSAAVIRNTLLGKKVEAEFVEIDTLETADERDLQLDFYENRIRQNLANLAKVLK